LTEIYHFQRVQGNSSLSAVEGISSNLFAAPDTWSWAIERTRKAKVMRNSRHVPFTAFQMTKPTQDCMPPLLSDDGDWQNKDNMSCLIPDRAELQRYQSRAVLFMYKTIRSDFHRSSPGSALVVDWLKKPGV
jgi:hypothetical protein